MDIGGHSQYFTITKVLIGGNTLFILTFDAGLYTLELHYRLMLNVRTVLGRYLPVVQAENGLLIPKLKTFPFEWKIRIGGTYLRLQLFLKEQKITSVLLVLWVRALN